MIKDLLKDGSIYTLSAILTRGLMILLLPLYTHMLAPQDFGVLDLIATIAALAHLTIALEINQALGRYYADASPDNKSLYYATAFWFSLGMYSLCALGALFFASDIARMLFKSTGFTGVVTLGIIWVWLTGLFNMLQAYFRWSLQSSDYAKTSVLFAAISLCASALGLWLAPQPLIGAYAGLCVGASAGIIFAARTVLRHVLYRIDYNKLKEMLKFSIPLVPASMAAFAMLYTDRLMINHFMTLEDVGLYATAFRLASVCGLISVGFQMALTPLILSRYGQADTPAHIADITRIFIAFSTCATIFIGCFAPEIISILAPPSYSPAALSLALLAPAFLASNLYLFAPGATIAHKTHIILVITMAGAALNMLLNLALVPPFGIHGAALATLASYIVVACLHFKTSQRLYPVPHMWRTYAFGAGLSFFVIAINWMLSPHVLVKAGLVIASLVLLIPLKLIKHHEIENAIEWLKAFKQRRAGL